MADRQFPIVYWGDDRSTQAQFHPITELPPIDSITACMVFAVADDGNVVLSKPARGWGLVGGHREPGESPEDCVRREAREEAAIELGELELIGHWKAEKLIDSEANRKYPSLGYQLLYKATISRIDEFTPVLEVTDRMFVPPSDVANYHHDFENVEEVIEYVRQMFEGGRGLKRMSGLLSP